jgi:DNA-binding IclR family transcriptional regulator
MGNPKRAADAFQEDREADTGNPQTVTALARGMAILRCFDGTENPLGNQEIATRTGLPKPTVSRLTFTLASLGYLKYSPAIEKYSLGVGILTLAHSFLKNGDVINFARPLMEELAHYTKAAVMLAESHDTRMVLLEICQGDEVFRLNLETGSRVPHSSTALGRAYLAALGQESFERFLEQRAQECPAGTWPKIKTGLLRARRDCEHYGFCFSLGDWNPDVFAVGVPMVSVDKSRILAFNVSGRVSVVSREQLVGDFGPKLVALRNKVFDLVKGRF